jgi:hypothetical protein
VRITASVKNAGELAGSYEAVLWIDGEVVDERAVQVGNDQTAQLSFEPQDLARGSHTVRIGTLRGSFTVGK